MRVFGLFALLFAGTCQARAVETQPRLVLNIGHTSQVNCLAVSPDRKFLASGGADATAKLWDAETHVLRFSLPHDAPVLAVGFANSATLITAAADQSLHLYNTATGALNAERVYGNGAGTAAAIAPGGARAAWGFADGKIYIREIGSGKTIPLEGHPTRVLALAFSPDGKTLASASDAYAEKPVSDEFARRSGDLRLWDAEDGERIKTLVGHALGVRGVAWSPDGKKLASIGDSGTAVLWDAQKFSKLKELNVTEGKGRSLALAFSLDGNELAVGWRGDCRTFPVAGDGVIPAATVQLLGNEALRSGQKAKIPVVPPFAKWTPPPPESEAVTALAYGPEGEILAGREGAVQMPFTIGLVTQTTTSPLRAMRLSPDGSLIATADAAGVARLWRSTDGTLVRAWNVGTSALADLAFAPDGSRLVVAGARGVRIFNPLDPTQRPLTGVLESNLSGPVQAVEFSADGKRLFVAGQGKNGITETAGSEVGLWTVADGTLVRKYNDFTGTVRSLRAGPDDALTAAAGRGDAAGEVVRWDGSGKLVSRVTLRGARTVALSPDGKRLVAGGAFLDENQDYAFAGDVLQGWNLRSGEQTLDLTEKAENASVMSSGYSADGALLATGSRDGAIRIWDMGPEKHLLKTLRSHSGPVIGVAFAPGPGEARLLYSAGSDGTVRCWRLSDGRALATMVSFSAGNQAAVVAQQDTEWVTVTPEGYFQSSPGAARHISWRIGNDVFPLSAFEGAFRRPDNVAAAMAGEPLPQASFGQGKDIPPSVAITQPQAGGDAANPLQVALAATGSKNIQSVQILVNGRVVATKSLAGTGGKPLEVGAKPLEVGAKPLEVGAKPLEVGAKPLEVGAKPLEVGAKPLEVGAKAVPFAHDREWDVTLSAPLPAADAGALTLKAIVTDGDGLQASDEIRLKRDGKRGASGTLYILSVGVSHYANAKYDLKFAAADATTFGTLWAGVSGSAFEAVRPLVLTDAGATSQAVAAALSNIARQAGPDDVVALFLSGHGVQTKAGAFYFASHDINLTDLDNTAVPWTLLKSALAGSKARRLVMFLDACHSGAALGASQAGGEAMAEDLVKGAGAVVFASSLGRQYSYENAALGHGAFTQALMEGIGGGKADLDAGTGKDGVINVEELLTYLRARVPQLTGGAQLPACPLLRDFGEPFPLARTH